MELKKAGVDDVPARIRPHSRQLYFSPAHAARTRGVEREGGTGGQTLPRLTDPVAIPGQLVGIGSRDISPMYWMYPGAGAPPPL